MDIINYYTSGITANGYISLLSNNLIGLKKTFYITGEADYSTLAGKIIDVWWKEKYSLELIHNPFNNDSLEAIINRTLKYAVVFNINQDLPNYISLSDKAVTIDLSVAIDKKKYEQHINSLTELKQSKFNCQDDAYLFFAKALKVHDEWESVYIANMDFNKADEIADNLIKTIIGDNKINKKPIIKDRFFGAATPDGSKDYVPDVTSNIFKRYLIKGRPGTGKSTILKKIGICAAESGYDVEFYHCGFDHNSLDMVILRELNVCVFDSTSPHEYYPERNNDEIVDVYKEAVKPETDEKYKEVLDDIVRRYKSNTNIATSYLRTMKIINNELIKYYNSFTNFSILENIYKEIIIKIS